MSPTIKSVNQQCSNAIFFLSWNVRGINDETKRKSVFRFLRNTKSSVMLLQETYSTKEVETRWTREWGNRIIFAHGTNHSKGVMILFKIGIDFEIKSCYRDTNGRFIICVLTINDMLYTISNIYAPDKEKEQVDFFHELKSAFVMQNMDVSDKVILGGIGM